MTTKEFSDQFDVLFNSVTSNQAPGLNEYEKSVFLTKAQDEIVKNYFIPEGNPHQKGFDSNQKRQIDFSMLMTTGNGTYKATGSSMDPRAYHFSIPKGVLYIINESVQFIKDEKVLAIRQIVPLSYDEYSRLMSKPYKEPVKYQAWRLITSKETTPEVDIIVTSSDKAKYVTNVDDNVSYVIRYVKRPRPIVLDNFSSTSEGEPPIYGEELSIHGVSTVTDCELDEAIHEEILQRAVELAKIAWLGEPAAVIQTGQRSE